MKACNALLRPWIRRPPRRRQGLRSDRDPEGERLFAFLPEPSDEADANGGDGIS
jgi:hypothetical protein